MDKTSAISCGIFRDHRGVPLFSYPETKFEGLGKTPYSAELGALFLGLVYAHRQGFKKLWIEGDSKFLIDVLEGRKANKWYDDRVVKRVMEHLDSQAFEVRPKLTFIHREGNMAADAIVKVIHDDAIVKVDIHVDQGEWEIDEEFEEELHNHPNAVMKVWKLDKKLPVLVKKVTNRERKGYKYEREACCYMDKYGPWHFW